MLAGLDWPDLVRRYAVGVEWFDPRLFHLPEAALDMPFRAERAAGASGNPVGGEGGVGRWPIRALLVHLADAELVWAHRLRRALSEDRPALADFDHESFLAGPLYGPGVRPGGAVRPPVAGSVALIHTLRRWSLDWLFDLDGPARARTALHPERGELDVPAMLALATWHLEHHAAYLNAKIAHLAGPAQPAAQPAGGCGPSCACAAAGAGDTPTDAQRD